MRPGKVQHEASTGPGFTSQGWKKSDRPQGVKGFFEWYENDGVVRASVNAVSGTAVGLGYYTTMPEGFTIEVDDKGDPIIPDEKKLCDDLGRLHNFDDLLPNAAVCAIVGGFCFVETRINKFPSKSRFKIIHPASVETIKIKQDGTLHYIIQKGVDDKGTKKPVRILAKYLTPFIYNKIANDWRGLSLVKSVESLLVAKDTAIINMDLIIKRYLAPRIIWKSTGSITPVQEAVEKSDADQDVYIGGLDPDDMEFSAQIVEVDGQAKFWEFIMYIDQLIYQGLFAPNVFYWRNATEASAKVLKEITDRHIGNVQRMMKRGVEAGFFARLLKANDKLDEKEDNVPRVNWGVPKTGVENVVIDDYLRVGVEMLYITQPVYFEILKMLGVDVAAITRDLVPDEEPDEEPDDGQEPGEPEKPGDITDPKDLPGPETLRE